MTPVAALLAGLLVAAGVTAGSLLYFQISAALAIPIGLIYGVYAWVLVEYPSARLLRFQSVKSDEQLLVTAFLLVGAAMFMVVPALELSGSQRGATFLAMLGGVLGLSTLGALLGVHGVFEADEGALGDADAVASTSGTGDGGGASDADETGGTDGSGNADGAGDATD